MSQFRAYQDRLFEFSPIATLITGPNAVGKTSIVEAVHLIATGDSFRAGKVEEMIRFGQELGRVSALIVGSKDDDETESSDTDELEILLTRGEVQGKKTLRRLYSVNKTRRRKKNFLGYIHTVVFRPEDMRLIEGSPGRRRSFVDTPLAMIDDQYARALKMYDQALRRCNKLLEQVREGAAPRTTLTYWNMTLLKHGEYIQYRRRQFLESFQKVSFPMPFWVVYKDSLLTEERQEQYQSKAIAAGHNLIGPHKDDFEVWLRRSPVDDNSAPGYGLETVKESPNQNDSGFNIATYGSRGQQRMAVLWLKLAERSYLEEKTGQKPLVMLDDILSELDTQMRSRVLSILPGHQAIITSADPAVEEEVAAQVSQLEVMTLTQ